MNPDRPPLRLIFDRGEEVFPEHEPETRTVLDPSSPPPIPIRPNVEIDLNPDFELF